MFGLGDITGTKNRYRALPYGFNTPGIDEAATNPSTQGPTVYAPDGRKGVGVSTYDIARNGMIAPPRTAPQAGGVQIDKGYLLPGMAVTGQGLGATGAALAAQGQARAQQMTAIRGLRDAAEGIAPSAAELQQQAGLEQGLRQNLALAASNRGSASSGVLAQRNAIQANAELAARTTAQGAALRAQEMAAARGQFADAATGLRTADLGAATAGLGLAGVGTTLTGQGAQLALGQGQLDSATQAQNLDAKLRTMGLDDTQRMGYLGAVLGIDTRTQAGLLAVQQLLSGNVMQAQAINAGIAGQNTVNNANLFAGVLSGGSQLGAAAVGA